MDYGLLFFGAIVGLILIRVATLPTNWSRMDGLGPALAVVAAWVGIYGAAALLIMAVL